VLDGFLKVPHLLVDGTDDHMNISTLAFGLLEVMTQDLKCFLVFLK